MFCDIFIHHSLYICFAQSAAGIIRPPGQNHIPHRRMDYWSRVSLYLSLGQGKVRPHPGNPDADLLYNHNILYFVRTHGTDDRMGTSVVYTSAFSDPCLHRYPPTQKEIVSEKVTEVTGTVMSVELSQFGSGIGIAVSYEESGRNLRPVQGSSGVSRTVTAISSRRAEQKGGAFQVPPNFSSFPFAGKMV